MRFTSTRNKTLSVGFAKAILNCMPSDGGLYVPADIADLRRYILYTDENTSFASIAGSLTSALINEEFSPIVSESIATSAFSFEPVLRTLDDNHFMLELFHGPSGYHRDFGIAYLISCLEVILKMQNSNATILSFAHFETGSTIIHELRGKKHIKAVLVYKKGCVSGISKEDFLWNGGNVYPIEVDGDEEVCYSFLRNIFSDKTFVSENKITVATTANIGRLLPQAFFYPFAFSRLKNKVQGDIYYALAPGNYSNVVAGLYSWRFSLPLSGFFIPSTNSLTVDSLGNCVVMDSLVQCTDRKVSDPTDPSNIERLEEVFSANKLMMRNFLYPVKLTDKIVDEAVKELFVKYNIFADRHTGRAYATAKAKREMMAEDNGSVVIIARDHPYFSKEYIYTTIGEKVEPSEKIKSILEVVSLNRPPIKSEEELRQIIKNITSSKI